MESVFEGLNRSGKILILAKCLTELILHAGVCRIVLGDPAHIYERRPRIALLAKSYAQVHLRCKIAGLERECLLKHVDGFTDFTTLGKSRAQIRLCSCGRGIKCDGLLELGDGTGQVSLLHDGDPQPIVRFVRGRTYLYGSLKGFEGMGIVV